MSGNEYSQLVGLGRSWYQYLKPSRALSLKDDLRRMREKLRDRGRLKQDVTLETAAD